MAFVSLFFFHSNTVAEQTISLSGERRPVLPRTEARVPGSFRSVLGRSKMPRKVGITLFDTFLLFADTDKTK